MARPWTRSWMTPATHHPGGQHVGPHPRTAGGPREHDRPAGRTRRRQADDRAGARRVRRRIQLERRHRAVAAAGLHRHRPGQPAARRDRRFGLHRQPAQPDRRPGAAGRALLRRRGHQQRREPAPPNVVGLVFVAAFAPDEGERLGEVARRVQGQHPEHGPGPVQLSHRAGTARPRSSSGSTRRCSGRSSPPTCRRRPPR